MSAPRPWTEFEIQRLMNLWGMGITVAQISEELDRSERAIVSKRLKLGLAPRRRTGRDHRINVTLTAELFMHIGRRATGRGQTKTSYIRSLLMRDMMMSRMKSA